MDGATGLHVPFSANATGEQNDMLTLVDYGQRVIALLTDGAGQVVSKNVALAGKLNLGRLAGGATLAGITRVADADDFIFAAGGTASLARVEDYAAFLLSSTGPVQISRNGFGAAYYKSSGVFLPGQGFKVIPLQQLLLEYAAAKPHVWHIWQMGLRLHAALWQDENRYICRSFASYGEADSLYYLAILQQTGMAAEAGAEIITIEGSGCEAHKAAVQLWPRISSREHDTTWLLGHLCE